MHGTGTSRRAGQGGLFVESMRTLVGSLPRFVSALLIIALLLCVLVPLPVGLVDLLLSLSLSAAVVLLVVSMTIRRSAEFLSFPRLLLLATLYRLALNVQTTRLILSQADAGRVVDAFATVIVRDDLIVGAVMFGIITAVQFLVITRGSERVAEVAARFALDGLPGHQAAIDADLRGGAISPREAVRRRAALVERSNFYGAMDGAVRFVKGDAAAGVAITIVNIVGGLVVGVVRHDHTLTESLRIYGSLAIGDGLMAQIPAVLVSLAAGVLVSRVDREREDASDGAVRWPWLEPAALFVPALLLAALVPVPRMPAGAFLVTATGLVCAGVWLGYRRQRAGVSRPREDAPAPAIEVSFGSSYGGAARHGRLRGALGAAREACQLALNIELPEIVAARPEPNAPTGDVLIHHDGMRLAACSVADVTTADALDPKKLYVVVYRAIRRSAVWFVDLQDIERRVEDVRQHRPAVVRAALEIVGLDDLLTLVHGFLRERITVPPMRALLSAVIEEPLLREASERRRWLELVRARVAAYWVGPALDAQRSLGGIAWIRPTPDAEREARALVVTGQGGVVLAATPAERTAWTAVITRGATPATGRRAPVLLTHPDARAAFAALTRELEPYVLVVTGAELDAAGISGPANAAVTWIDAP